MKRICYWLLFSFLLSGCKDTKDIEPAQELFRYINDTREILVPANDRIFIRTGASPDYFKRKYPEIREFNDSEIGLHEVYVYPQNNVFDLLNKLSQDHEVIYVSPFLLLEDGKEFGGFTNKIMARLKEDKSLNDLKKAFGNYEVEEYKKSAFDEAEYEVILKTRNAVNSLFIANKLHETEDCFVYVEVKYLMVLGIGMRGLPI